jgi:hypothetical protein
MIDFVPDRARGHHPMPVGAHVEPGAGRHDHVVARELGQVAVDDEDMPRPHPLCPRIAPSIRQ